MAAQAKSGGEAFPTTRVSLALGLKDADPERAHRSFGRLAEVYGKPLYKHVRLKWHKPEEDARDLVQAFLTVAFERDYLAAWDPERARFRSFLKTCVDRFVSKDNEAWRAQKRGGGARTVPLDFATAERELACAAVPDVESVFEQEWARSVFEMALSSLREALSGTSNDLRLRVFEAYDLEDSAARPSYQAVAERFGIPVATVNNHLHFVRRELRRHVIETLRELCTGEEELRAEVRTLLGEAL